MYVDLSWDPDWFCYISRQWSACAWHYHVLSTESVSNLVVLRQDFCQCRPRDSSTGYEVSALNLLARSSGIADWQGFQKSFFPNKKIKKGRTHQEMHEECWKFVRKWVSPSWWRTPSSRWGHVPAWNSFTSTLQLGLGTQGDPDKSCWWMPKTCTNHNPKVLLRYVEIKSI